jgi:hypothetical protein
MYLKYGFSRKLEISRLPPSAFLPPPLPDAMVDNLVGDGDEERTSLEPETDEDEERTSLEPETARLAAVSPTEARKGT